MTYLKGNIEVDEHRLKYGLLLCIEMRICKINFPPVNCILPKCLSSLRENSIENVFVFYNRFSLLCSNGFCNVKLVLGILKLRRKIFGF